MQKTTKHFSPNTSSNKKLPPSFYLQDTIEVARQLLGKRLVHIFNGKKLSGVIVETEAYLGAQDPACHSFGYKKTPRTSVMFQPGGCAYVYFIYGMYHCLNVVSGPEGEPEAVLIRAIAPDPNEENYRQMIANRKMSFKKVAALHPKDLCGGPGKLAQAFAITRSLNGLSFQSPTLYIEEASSFADSDIVTSERIGISPYNEAAFWPLRFYVKGHPCISVT
ncbi:MAG: DNA-3-methyladenine glycosylase [Bdellovibrio sp.]|nr:MAG: DNA-3-methyladenine glycosylase [Bdellovibrio sp.]